MVPVLFFFQPALTQSKKHIANQSSSNRLSQFGGKNPKKSRLPTNRQYHLNRSPINPPPVTEQTVTMAAHSLNPALMSRSRTFHDNRDTYNSNEETNRATTPTSRTSVPVFNNSYNSSGSERKISPQGPMGVGAFGKGGGMRRRISLVGVAGRGNDHASDSYDSAAQTGELLGLGRKKTSMHLFKFLWLEFC